MVVVYVGGLSKDVTEESLRELFSRRVQIKGVEINKKHVKIFNDIERAPVFAFLDCVCDEDQLAKVLAYNKCYWNGTYLRVQVAKKGPYMYIPKASEEMLQTDIQRFPEPHTESNSYCSSKKDSIDTGLEVPLVDPSKPPEDVVPSCPRRKRMRVFNTLRPSICS
ncbi:Hypothetical protein GLP15_4320 [Giardia lamblia P15]|uniref:RRM domain-containing protein n=1 Tax=Giardia intestinalis (strain P15) TaxID=658858 RepID=E1EWV0_GIAIA|nr:Hypothetical protein GLP15_4320 [Giardia lamblia P15]